MYDVTKSAMVFLFKSTKQKEQDLILLRSYHYSEISCYSSNF